VRGGQRFRLGRKHHKEDPKGGGGGKGMSMEVGNGTPEGAIHGDLQSCMGKRDVGGGKGYLGGAISRKGSVLFATRAKKGTS